MNVHTCINMLQYLMHNNYYDAMYVCVLAPRQNITSRLAWHEVIFDNEIAIL